MEEAWNRAANLTRVIERYVAVIKCQAKSKAVFESEVAKFGCYVVFREGSDNLHFNLFIEKPNVTKKNIASWMRYYNPLKS